jgi:CheY-like chemotaxis protein
MSQPEHAAAAEKPEPIDAPPDGGAPDHDGIRRIGHRHALLLVEDNPDLRAAVSTLLKLEGFQVSTAANGAQALEWLAQSPPPCLILLDLMMPVSNGWDFRRQQLESRELTAIPTVLFSAHDGVAQKAAELGIVAVLPKPVDFDVLSSLVERLCAPRCGTADEAHR